jgi:Flp pilus assembly protein CpaB
VKLIVQNVQVLGTMVPTQPSDDGGAGAGSSGGEPTETLVVLAVTPQQAELVRYAMIDGNLSLIMRSPLDADAPEAQTTGVTLRELIDEHGVLPPRPIVTTYP